MKKVFAIILVLVLVLGTLTGCGNESASNISIDDLSKAVMHATGYNCSFSKRETDNGIAFDAKLKGGAYEPSYSVSGTATKKGMVKTIDYTFSPGFSDISEYYNGITLNGLINDSKNYNKVPGGRLMFDVCIMSYTEVLECLLGQEIINSDLGTIIDSRNSAQIIGNWTFTMELESSVDSATIHAVYGN